jgi:hypothetical protein
MSEITKFDDKELESNIGLGIDISKIGTDVCVSIFVENREWH